MIGNFLLISLSSFGHTPPGEFDHFCIPRASHTPPGGDGLLHIFKKIFSKNTDCETSLAPMLTPVFYSFSECHDD